MQSAIDPQPPTRLPSAPEVGAGLKSLLSRAMHVLCVGEVGDDGLGQALRAAPGSVTIVAPGDATLDFAGSGRGRPHEGSFGAWQAVQEESDRARVGAFVLGRQAGRADVEILRHRVHAHPRVFVEPGAPALTWLLATWGGRIVRHERVFVLSEPARHFREPSGRFNMSEDAGWPRVTVVTVSFNQCNYLEQCLRSVLDQRYPNLEYIVVDAGSTDGSVELLRSYERHLSKLIVEPDRGQSDGLNKGFRAATGEILTWVNSDDMLAPLALKRAAMAIRTTGADLVAGMCKRVNGEGLALYKHYSAFATLRLEQFALQGPLAWANGWEKSNYFFQPEVFFSRSIWERAGGYLKPHLFWAMDWELWLRCALAGASIVRVPDILAVSREHVAQKTTGEEMYLWQIFGILQEYDDMLAAVGEHLA
jgi:GT2 family glycosyltransferase